MLTFSLLGEYGRLGNQLFQYAALAATACDLGQAFAIRESGHDLAPFHRKHCLYLPPGFQAERIFNETPFGFDPEIKLVRGDTDLRGYFQSPRYFDHHRTYIRNEFDFPDSLTGTVQRAWEKYAGTRICSIHVRRKDYLDKPDFHPVCGPGYYAQAMAQMRSWGVDRFVVFSDDREWCEVHFKGLESVSFFGGDAHEDLYAMTLCDAHIVANSSFSWWGAYLAGSECVIAPKTWFGADGPYNWDDIYMDDWTLI